MKSLSVCLSVCLFQKQKEFKFVSNLSGHWNIGWRHNLETIDSDSVVFSWPWQWFTLGKADNPLLVTSHQYVIAKITFGWSAVASCACTIMQVFSVAFYLIRTVHKFDFRLVMNDTPNKWRTVGRGRGNHAVVLDQVLPGLNFLFRTIFASVKGLYLRFAGRLHSPG